MVRVRDGNLVNLKVLFIQQLLCKVLRVIGRNERRKLNGIERMGKSTMPQYTRYYHSSRKKDKHDTLCTI